MESIGAYALVWPATVVIFADRIPEAQKTWLKGRLTFMADQYGIEQARVVRDTPIYNDRVQYMQ